MGIRGRGCLKILVFENFGKINLTQKRTILECDKFEGLWR